MARLLNYLLLLVGLFCLLGLVVPFGLFETGFKDIGGYNNQHIDGYKDALFDIIQPGYNKAGSLSSIIVFMSVATITLFLQQFFWIKKLNTFNDFPVPNRLIKKYMSVLYSGIATIIFTLFWFLLTWLLPVPNITGTPDELITAYLKVYETRHWMYIGGIIIVSLISLVTVALASYFSLMISYNQRIQFVDQQIELGNYDPITREPYVTEASIDNATEIIKDNKIDDIKSDDYKGSSMLGGQGEV